MPIIPEPSLIPPLAVLRVREAHVIAKRPVYVLDNFILMAKYDVWRAKDERKGQRKVLQAYRVLWILSDARIRRTRKPR